MSAPATLYFFGVAMNLVTIPTLSALRTTAVALELQAALGVDCRLGLVGLWSLEADHGAGPYRRLALEIACEWQGANGAFVEALLGVGCVEAGPGTSVLIRPWRDVLGYVEPVPVNETPEERRRRQTREAMRRHRAGKIHNQSHLAGLKSGERSVSIGEQSVSNGEQSVSKREQSVSIGERNVSIGEPKTTPSRARSLSLDSEKYSEAEEEPEAEKNYVVSTAIAVPTATLPGAVEAAPRLMLAVNPSPVIATVPEAAGTTLPATVTTATATADRQERPALASGATISPSPVSVPLTLAFVPPEAAGGDSGKRSRKRQKAAVSPEAVAEPIRQVWSAYADVVGTRVVLSAARAKIIEDRLADGWSSAELVEAVRGYGKSAWHFGANDRGTRFTSIELWLRDAAHVEQGLGYHKEAAKAEVKKPSIHSGFEEKFAKFFEENPDGKITF